MSTLHVENLKGLSSGGNANKIIVPSGQTLTAPGHLIQVGSATRQTYTTFTSSVYVTSGLELSFTPKFANSKLHVMCTSTLAAYANAATVGAVFKRTIGGSVSYSPLGTTGHGLINTPDGATMAAYCGNDGAGNNRQTPFTMEWYDTTHNTTGAITYTVMVASNSGSSSYVCAMGGLGDNTGYHIVSTLSVREIAQ